MSKGSWRRPYDAKKYGEAWDQIWGPKAPSKDDSSSQEVLNSESLDPNQDPNSDPNSDLDLTEGEGGKEEKG